MFDDSATAHSPRPSAYDRLSDSLDAKILDFNLKIFGLIATILLKPLSLATDPFFRKHLGIRYLNGMSLMICLFLWTCAQKLSSMGTFMLYELAYNSGWYKTAEWLGRTTLSRRVAYIIAFVYGFIAVLDFIKIRTMHMQGKIWHSMSRGESRFGSENVRRDALISVIVSIVLIFVVPAIGLLFAASRVASYLYASKQEQSLYARYLDAMDAKIEAEYLEKTLRDGEPPKNTDGIYAPLAKGLQGPNRAEVARTIAGAPVRVMTKPNASAKTATPEMATAG